MWSPNKTSITKKLPLLLKILLVIVVSALVLGILGFALITYELKKFSKQYDGSEQAIQSEMQSLALPADNEVSRSYRHGVCFDNCPEMTYTYSFSSPRDTKTVFDEIEKDLQAHGYKTENYQSITAVKQNGRYEMRVESTSNNSDPTVTGLKVRMTYNPSIN